MGRRPAEPTLAQIEQAWRGEAITEAPIELPAPPKLSKTIQRLNLALLLLAACLYATGAIGMVLQTGPAIVFGAMGLANLVVAMLALSSQRVLGITFRSRFIARREREPVLYWSSFVVFAAFGAFLLLALLTTAR